MTRKTPEPPALASSKGTYAFVSLGCPKNLVDSERMLGLLQLDGYELVNDPDGADFVIVNTCGFIKEARRESFGAIDQMLRLKREGRTRGVIVTGCLAERQKQELLDQRPDIDQLIGVFGREEVTRAADRLLGNQVEQRTVFRPAPVRPLPDRDRFRITPRHYAYLKVSEGCDRLCTFCAIPRMRGKHASKPMGEVLDEAAQLARDGVRELIVVAQDTTYYGIDLDGKPHLTELLRELDQIDVQWIRVMYFYPMFMDDTLIQTLADARKIIPYVDVPLQHINDQMLHRMARRVTRKETEQLIGRLRQGIPELTLRTTLITGFPGETEEAFEQLMAFVRQQQFERLGVFPYSNEPDTPAAKLPNQVPPGVCRQRRDLLMQLQQGIVFARNQRQIGQSREVIVDRPVAGQAGVWIARSWADAPDVDCVVFLTESNDQPLAPGAITRCEIVATHEYDLVGAATGESW